MAVAVSGGELNCRKCNKEQKRERGCYEDSIIPNRWEIEGDVYQRCPMKLVTQQSSDYIQAYGLFKSGFLPNGIGWANETSKFLYAMQIIERLRQKEVQSARQ